MAPLEITGATPPFSFLFEIAAGNISGCDPVNKFGRSTNVDLGIDTDIWDRANAVDDQDIWLAPTQARIHTIASDSAQDVTGGTGANTVIILYLRDWSTAQAVEIVTGNLNAGIAMTNPAAMIHRMRVVPQVTSTTPNVGTITATAAVDGTVTAQISPGAGQTQMAIYGVPSVQTAYMPKYYSSAIEALANTSVALTLLINPNPNIQLLSFLTQHTIGVTTRGMSYVPHRFEPEFKIVGPAIVKMQGNASAQNADVSAGFDLVLVDN